MFVLVHDAAEAITSVDEQVGGPDYRKHPDDRATTTAMDGDRYLPRVIELLPHTGMHILKAGKSNCYGAALRYFGHAKRCHQQAGRNLAAHSGPAGVPLG